MAYVEAWSNISEDLLSLIVSRLPSPDIANLSVVCKAWHSTVGPIYSQPSSVPMLLHKDFEDESNNCFIYSNLTNNTYAIDMPDLIDTEIQYAKDGWVIASRLSQFFVLNPLTGERHDLPDFECYLALNGICLSISPSSATSDNRWMVFALCSDVGCVVLCLWRSGDENWTTISRLDIFSSFEPSQCAPLFFEELFYCLDKRGKLGTFDPKDNTWSTLAEPQGVMIRSIWRGHRFLMEMDNEIHFMYVGGAYKRDADDLVPQIFKLDRSRMRWSESEGLREDMVVFSDLRTSIMVNASHVPKEMRAKVFYSMTQWRWMPPIPARATWESDHVFFVPTGENKPPSEEEGAHEWHFLASQGNGDDKNSLECYESRPHADDCVFYSFESGRVHPAEVLYLARIFPNSIWFNPRAP